MNKITRLQLPWRKIAYYIGISIGLLIFLQQLWLGWQAMELDLIRQNSAYLLLALSLTMVAYALQMLAWSFVMWGLGVSISLSAVFQGYMLSFLPRYIPGTIWGYLGRNEWLKVKYDTPYRLSTFGSLLEVGLTILTAGNIALAYYLWTDSVLIQGEIIVGTLAIPLISWYGLQFITKSLPQFPLLNRLQSLVFDLKPFHWLAAYITYLIFWSCHGLALLFLTNIFANGIETSIYQSIFAFSFSWLIGFAILIVPSGLGIREFVLSNLLADQLIPLEAASAIAVTSRFLIYLAEIIWIVFGLITTRTSLRMSE